MWDYSLVIPNCFVLITFLLFYVMKPRLEVRIHNAFINTIFTEIALVVIDPISSYLLEHVDSIPILTLNFANVCFFLLFILRSYLFFSLSCAILQFRIEKHKILLISVFTVFAIGMLLSLSNIYFTPIFKITKAGYSRSFLYDIIYFISFFYLFLSFGLVLCSRKKHSHWRCVTVLLFNLVLLSGYIIRKVLPTHLIMDSFCLIAIIIIYAGIDNFTFYLEGRTGVFNSKALIDLLEEKEGCPANLIMGIGINNYGEMREIFGTMYMDLGIRQIGQYLKKTYPLLTVFYVSGGIFIVVGRNGLVYESVRKEMLERFKKPWQVDESSELTFEANFAHIESGLKIKNSQLIVQGLISALTQVEPVQSGSITVTETAIKNIEIKTEIKRSVEYAVENNTSELFLQPIVSAKTFDLVGAEALARIRNRNDEIISPSLFIPIAERNGRINSLGKQMFEKTCAFIENHDIDSMGISWINVNLSPLQFLSNDLNDNFSTILNLHDIPAEKLHLEITEEAMIDYTLLQNQIQNMKETGFSFVLDDYGSGYSNVSRLKSGPFINVKLDMGIVWDYFKSRDEILPTLVQAFKRMNFSVTAEGIESEEMARAMKDIGCDYLQGFYFSKPMPAEEFAVKYSKK